MVYGMNRQQIRPSVFSHPYLLLCLGCMLVYASFSAGQAEAPLPLRSVLLPAICTALGTAWFMARYCICGSSHLLSVLTVIFSAACVLCAAMLCLLSSHPLSALTLLLLLMLAAAGFWEYRQQWLSDQATCILLGAGAFFLHACYILYTSYLTRQHDVFPVSQSEGHQAYILYFVDHNFALPDFAPNKVWEFYHPPLHYFLSAMWVKLQMFFGANTETAIENVQFLSLFYSCAVIILGYRILQALHLKGAALTLPFAILCFHPMLILLAGSINNDVLCLALTMASILYAIRWYQSPTVKNILLLGLFLGLAMMAKSAGVLAAPAVAVLFLIRLIKGKGKRRGLWKQYGLFLLVCAPLGLWWSLYGKIRFQMPFGAISALAKNNPQYLGTDTPLQRLFSIDWQHLTVFENWDWQNQVFEHNLFTALFKTSVFDEAKLFTGGVGLCFSQVLFWTNILLAAAAFVCMVRCAVQVGKSGSLQPYRSEVLFCGVLYGTCMAFYIWFCFKQPFACTQSFRYIFPTVLVGTVGIGAVLQEHRPRAVTCALALLITLFCVCSAGVYLLLGTK